MARSSLTGATAVVALLFFLLITSGCTIPAQADMKLITVWITGPQVVWQQVVDRGLQGAILTLTGDLSGTVQSVYPTYQVGVRSIAIPTRVYTETAKRDGADLSVVISSTETVDENAVMALMVNCPLQYFKSTVLSSPSDSDIINKDLFRVRADPTTYSMAPQLPVYIKGSAYAFNYSLSNASVASLVVSSMGYDLEDAIGILTSTNYQVVLTGINPDWTNGLNMTYVIASKNGSTLNAAKVQEDVYNGTFTAFNKNLVYAKKEFAEYAEFVPSSVEVVKPLSPMPPGMVQPGNEIGNFTVIQHSEGHVKALINGTRAQWATVLSHFPEELRTAIELDVLNATSRQVALVNATVTSVTPMGDNILVRLTMVQHVTVSARSTWGNEEFAAVVAHMAVTNTQAVYGKSNSIAVVESVADWPLPNFLTNNMVGIIAMSAALMFVILCILLGGAIMKCCYYPKDYDNAGSDDEEEMSEKKRNSFKAHPPSDDDGGVDGNPLVRPPLTKARVADAAYPIQREEMAMEQPHPVKIVGNAHAPHHEHKYDALPKQVEPMDATTLKHFEQTNPLPPAARAQPMYAMPLKMAETADAQPHMAVEPMYPAPLKMVETADAQPHMEVEPTEHPVSKKNAEAADPEPHMAVEPMYPAPLKVAETADTRSHMAVEPMEPPAYEKVAETADTEPHMEVAEKNEEPADTEHHMEVEPMEHPVSEKNDEPADAQHHMEVEPMEPSVPAHVEPAESSSSPQVQPSDAELPNQPQHTDAAPNEQ